MITKEGSNKTNKMIVKTSISSKVFLALSTKNIFNYNNMISKDCKNNNK